MGDKKEEEDALGFHLDISEGGEEGESALSLLYDRFEGGGEENDSEEEGYPSFYSDIFASLENIADRPITHLNVKIFQQLNLVSELCLL